MIRRIVTEFLRNRNQPNAVLGELADVKLETEGITKETRERVHHEGIERPVADREAIMQFSLLWGLYEEKCGDCGGGYVQISKTHLGCHSPQRGHWHREARRMSANNLRNELIALLCTRSAPAL